ncbi:MAG: hypothetical protein SFV32_01150 [Opitutaceae bacterium]|nr:hypothetical protein [Opitutaceae bacterium]
MSPVPPHSPILGLAAPPAPRIALRAGPLTVDYDAGDLRYLRIGSVLLLARVHAAVRDRNWVTVPGTLSDERTEIGEHSFSISYQSRHQQGDVDFIWRARIQGDGDGRIEFSFEGECLSSFETNRIGFCVLHPQEVAGQPCEVEYVDGTRAALQWPRFVSAEQPVPGFTDIRELSQGLPGGGILSVRMEGDAFETEDQRNWIDASFKTFCTPLRHPYPRRVERGACIRQRIVISARAGFSLPVGPVSGVSIEDFGERHRMPEIGFGVTTAGRPLGEKAADALRSLHPRHLRVDLGWDLPEYKGLWEVALAESRALAASLEVALHLDPAREDFAAEWARFLIPHRERMVRVLVYVRGKSSIGCEAFDAASKALGHLGVPLFAGTNADFYHLTRSGMPSWPRAEGVAWSMNPQVHATDWASIAETPQAIPAQLATAARWFPGKALVVSPLTLRPRFLPDAKGPVPPTPEGVLPFSVDVRQRSLVAGVWLAAALARLAEGGAHSVTVMETRGWRGLLEDEEGSRLPEQFPSKAGEFFPAFHVLEAFTRLTTGSIRILNTSSPHEVVALEMGSATWLLGNLTPFPVEVFAPAWKGRRLVGSSLNAVSWSEACTRPGWFIAPENMRPQPLWSQGRLTLSGGELLLARPV